MNASNVSQSSSEATERTPSTEGSGLPIMRALQPIRTSKLISRAKNPKRGRHIFPTSQGTARERRKVQQPVTNKTFKIRSVAQSLMTRNISCNQTGVRGWGDAGRGGQGRGGSYDHLNDESDSAKSPCITPVMIPHGGQSHCTTRWSESHDTTRSSEIVMVPQGGQRQSWYHKVVKDRTLMRTSRICFSTDSQPWRLYQRERPE